MDFAIKLDNTDVVPLHQQLYEELRQAILSGRLEPRQRLPSTRALAKSLGVSRATVTLSYEQLVSEGYLQTVPGSGTFISHQLPDELLRPTPIHSTHTAQRSLVGLSNYGITLTKTEPLGPEASEALINFSHYGRPALDKFPLGLWRRLLSHSCQVNSNLLDYATDTLGYKPLREAIARYLTRSRAVRCSADQIIITSGSGQALDLVTRILVERGDLVALEDPGYLGARRTFLAQGAQLWPVPVDDSGAVVEQLSAWATLSPKFIYVTPSHQFPTGAVLSLPRRLALLAWAQKTGTLIVEDDYDSEYCYGSRPIPALQGLDQSQSVVYIGTFSKVLFPSLRVGYLVVPQSLVHVFAQAKWLADRQSPLIEQHALTDFVDEGHLESHIRRMRTLYEQRRQTLVQALTLHLGQQVTILGENAGMHMMVRLQNSSSDQDIVRCAALCGVGIASACPYYVKSGHRGEFILGYADLSDEEIQDGVRRLAQALMKLDGCESTK